MRWFVIYRVGIDGMLLAIVCLFAAAHFAAAQAPSKPKHIVWVVVDDLGWADVSYKARMYPTLSNLTSVMPPTPNIDSLALNGVRLESYYVHALCSPSRTAFLSGRYAYTTGSNAEVIVNGVPDQLPTNIRTVADLLSAHGWATSAYGKWDLGMTSWGCTPLCRGFDHFSGFYNAFNDYFKHRVGEGLDLHLDFVSDTARANQTGVYQTELITERVRAWINRSVTTRGPHANTFAYVAHEAIHAPQQVPASYLTRCAGIPADQPIRKMSCGQMVAVDDSVGGIANAYAALGILQDTLWIFTADNGPNTDTGGSAWPLRGMKASMYEGGVRGVGFVSGAGLASAVRGSISHELYSLVDWLPTIVQGIAGINISEAAEPKHPFQPAPPPLDGMDVWPSLSEGRPSPRTEALLYLDPLNCFGGDIPVPCHIPGQAAFRRGRYKVIRGHVSTYAGPGNVSSGFCGPRDGVVQGNTIPLVVTKATTPPFCPTGWVPPPGSGLAIIPPPEVPECTQLPCVFFNSTLLTGGVWLYDVVNDPFELHDLASAQPEVVQELLAALEAFNNSAIPQAHSPIDPASNPVHFGAIWTPWRGNPDPSVCDPNATAPGTGLKSNFDGAQFTTGADGTVTVELVGWAWSSQAADGGRAPLNVSFFLDGASVGSVLATVSRPGLIPKTGAPNAEHGFAWSMPAAAAARASAGKHTIAVSADNAGAWEPLVHSPQCYCNRTECACGAEQRTLLFVD